MKTNPEAAKHTRWRYFGHAPLLRRFFAHVAQPLFEFTDTPEQIGKLLHRDHLAFGLAVGLGRSPNPFLTIGDIMHDAGLRGDLHAVADFEVPGESDLPAQHDV